MSSPWPTKPSTICPHSLCSHFLPLFLSPSPPAAAVLLLFLQHSRPSLTSGPLHLLSLLPGMSSPHIHHACSFLFPRVLACQSPHQRSLPRPPCLKQAPISTLSNPLQPLLRCSLQHLPPWVSYFIFTYYLPNWNAGSLRVWLYRNCSPKYPQGLKQGQIPCRCSENFC